MSFLKVMGVNRAYTSLLILFTVNVNIIFSIMGWNPTFPAFEAWGTLPVH